MPSGFAMQKLFTYLAILIGGTAFTEPGKTQPAGGDVTGPATGGTSGGNSTGGSVTGGPTTGGATTGGNTSGGDVTGGGVTGGNVTGGNVGVNVGEERRFTVTFKTFFVYDETGCDSCGSDEVQFIVRTPDYILVSPWYGNLDSSYVPFSGDGSPIPYTFDRCAQPAVDGDSAYNRQWECDPKGKAPPFSFTVEAYEDDDYDLPFTGFCGDNLQVIDERGPDIFRTTAAFCIEDDGELIGKEKVELTLNDLAELQEPGQSVYKDVVLRGGCDGTDRSCAGVGGGPHYSIRYEVKRLPDAAGVVPVDPNP